MLSAVQRYPTTAIAGLIGILVIVAASAIMLDSTDAASQRFGLILGIAGTIVTGILSTFRAESSTRAARRADEGVQAAKVALDANEQLLVGRTPAFEAQLAALRTLLQRTETKVDAVVETVANGGAQRIIDDAAAHAAGEAHTRAEDGIG